MQINTKKTAKGGFFWNAQWGMHDALCTMGKGLGGKLLGEVETVVLSLTDMYQVFQYFFGMNDTPFPEVVGACCGRLS